MQETLVKTEEQKILDFRIIKDKAMDPLRIEWRMDGQLWVSYNGTTDPVQVTNCFPWSEPDRYISLRDDDENEIALVENLDDLDDLSRVALERALVEIGFVLRISRVVSVNEDFEIRNWVVETEQGNRSFQTGLDIWPVKLPGGGILIRDVAGDLFHIEDITALDNESQKHLWAFIG